MALDYNIPRKPAKRPISCRMYVEDVRRLTLLCELEGISAAQWVARAVADAISERLKELGKPGLPMFAVSTESPDLRERTEAAAQAWRNDPANHMPTRLDGCHD